MQSRLGIVYLQQVPECRQGRKDILVRKGLSRAYTSRMTMIIRHREQSGVTEVVNSTGGPADRIYCQGQIDTAKLPWEGN
jgi:hypothetical protein